MTEAAGPGLGDLLGMLGGTNPIAAIVKNIEQLRRGVNDFLGAVENFNKTMETLNTLAGRATALFDDVEAPIRTMAAQLTRSVAAADAAITRISGPVEQVAPGISRLAETLASPVFTTMPTDISSFLDTLGDFSRRLQPLAQMAENAGSVLGLRSFASLLGGGGGSAQPAPRPSAPAPSPAPAPPSPAPTSAPKPKPKLTRKASPAKASPAKKGA